MTKILKKAMTLALLTTLQPALIANGLEKKIQQLTSRTINHPATLTIPKPNGKLYVIRGKDVIKHRNPKKENYNIVLKLIEYKDNGKKGYSFSDRILIEVELNYLQPPDKNGYGNIFENKNVRINIGVGYKKRSLIEACFDGIISSPYSVLTKDKQDQISTIIAHALRELDPKLYQKKLTPKVIVP